MNASAWIGSAAMQATQQETIMKLYYTPGACSLSPHIVAREAGLNVDLEKVDLREHKFNGGADFLQVNPKGQVPALELDDGDVLTEGPAIVQYLADRAPASKLAPQAGSKERYQLQEWLNFITSEIHKTLSPLFKPNTPEAYRTVLKETLANRLSYVEKRLADKPFLMGEAFTAADAYLFVMLTWTHKFRIDLSQWPRLNAYEQRISARPKVREALTAEGLLGSTAAAA
jgi:glutathione S-transferase